ncbi:3-methyl-2-oxobutanoate hydroxymethyltransferase [Desulfuribacillus alkaliarsenatis]|uniref:3-methyl-2-oxobutanoate hydroxymethyltransferase n=1 Tax=Desulfuribacillus alkaliarsenatis TaxID=766136 RepID=A0A1E5G6D9_9FIRM|nr:3-methyl-2-oxobutanoate hydroxymethyltransferase [Desulfuribacillus alkaliarsenatis]OEF98741.1 3-methyl-2-oxobutanoate hydroxymethyltransferase [Desulfuribacillus alkaliarsenatis]
MKKVTTATIRNKKGKEKISVLTAYDYPTAKILDEAGVDILLVGDSLGMVVLGYDSTVPVTLSDMIHHGKAVVRGASRAFVVVDMPFMSYHISIADTMKNAAEIMQKTGAASVKLEGGVEICDTISALTNAGIPVMGHIGLLPQSVNQVGGYSIQGKTVDAANKLLQDAIALEQAGAYAIVLECIPYQLAKAITEQIGIPTIGIGAGVHCDGQVLVTNDMLGLYDNFTPKFVRQYTKLHESIKEGAKQYIEEVRTEAFPTMEHSFEMKNDVYLKLYGGK